MGSRLTYLDLVRAFGIVMVVLGHAVDSIIRSGDLAYDPVLFNGAFRTIYSFHMPLFFLLAGLSQQLSSRRSPAVVARSVLPALIYPYVLWTLITFGLKLAFPGAAHAVPRASELVWHILADPIDHLWFLHMLVIVRLIWLGFEMLGSPALVRLAAAVPAALVVIDSALGFTGFPAWIFYWSAFFGIGTLLPAARLPELPARIRLVAAVLGFALWLAIVVGVPDLNGDVPSVVRLIAALAAATAILSLASFAPPPTHLATRLFAFLGEASLAIYLAHPIVGSVVRQALTRFVEIGADELVPVYLAAGLAVPATAYAVAVLIGRRTGVPVSLLLGFGAARRLVYLGRANR
jgi:fucose 4-O-acetylase-like acetyltransferase